MRLIYQVNQLLTGYFVLCVYGLDVFVGIFIFIFRRFRMKKVDGNSMVFCKYTSELQDVRE